MFEYVQSFAPIVRESCKAFAICLRVIKKSYYLEPDKAEVKLEDILKVKKKNSELSLNLQPGHLRSNGKAGQLPFTPIPVTTQSLQTLMKKSSNMEIKMF